MSGRTWFSVAALAVVVVGYFVVPALVRSHVDGLIQASVGKALPPFAALDTAGQRWSADALRGKRVLLHFFRSHCHSCDLEAPEIRALEARLPADVVLLHVMTDRVLDFPAEVTARTIADKAFGRPVLLADAAFVDAFHHVAWSNVTPITYVVDAAGVVRYGLRGRQSAAAIETALAAAK